MAQVVTCGLLLDRDGTLTEEVGHLGDPACLVPIPFAQEAVAQAHRAGWRIGVVTNQSAIGRGHATEGEVAAVHARMMELFPDIAAVRHCPHVPEAGCRCRKPEPGMVLDLIDELGLDPSRSVLVGDNITDLHAARSASVAGVLVRTGHGDTHAGHALAEGFAVCDDLAHAVRRFVTRGTDVDQ